VLFLTALFARWFWIPLRPASLQRTGAVTFTEGA